MARVDPLEIVSYPGNCGLADWSAPVDLNCFQFPGSQKPAYQDAVSDQTARNRLVSLLMARSDTICTEEMGELSANEATTTFGLDVISTAATTAANIVTGDQARQILTGAGTLAGASRSHVSADIYRQTVSHAISRAIFLERQRLRSAIEGRFTQTHSEYVIDQAIRDVVEYHNTCSFYRGLELVLASVEGTPTERDAAERRAKIAELEQRAAWYRAQMVGLSGTEKETYSNRLKAILDRIDALTFARVTTLGGGTEFSDEKEDHQTDSSVESDADGDQPPESSVPEDSG